jgi:hypothetical protein
MAQRSDLPDAAPNIFSMSRLVRVASLTNVKLTEVK